MKCPYCKKPDINKRHTLLCGKNPNRIRSPGRPKALNQAPTPETVAVPPAGTNGSTGTEGVGSQDLVLEVESSGRDQESMPDLSAPKQEEPNPADLPIKPTCDLIVKIVCEMEDGLVRQKMPAVLPAGAPPFPGPVSETQKEILSAAMVPVAEKWLPHLLIHPEWALAVVAAATFGPRWIAARRVVTYLEQEKHRVRGVQAKEQVPVTRQYSEDELLAMGDATLRNVGVPQA